MAAANVPLEQVMDALPALVSFVTKNEVYAYANAAYRVWFDHDPQEIVGRPLQEVLGAKAYEVLRPRIRGALAGEAQDFECDVPYARGTPRRVHAHYVPQYGPQGQVEGYIGLIQDLMARPPGTHLEDLHDLVENVNVGLHWVDAEGRIIWANQHELEMLGYQPQEYIGRPIEEIHVDPKVAQRFLQTLHGNGRLEQEEARLRRKDGSIAHVLVSSTARFANDRFLHTRCITTDISQWKREEVARRRFEKRLLRRQTQQAALVGLGHRALAAGTQEELFDAAAEAVCAALSCQHATILAADSDAFIVRAQRGWGDIAARMPSADFPQAAWTLAQASTAVVTDTRSDARFETPPALQAHGIRSAITVPIATHEGVWGVLGVLATRRLAADDESSFVEAAANIVASALQRLERESELVAAMRRSATRERQQAAVAHLGRRAMAAPDLATVCQDVATTIASTLDHEFSAVLRWLPDQHATELVGQVGWGEDFIGSVTPATPDTQVGYTIGQQAAVVVDDFAKDPRFRGHEALRRERILCGMSVVVPGIDGPWGVITTHSRHREPYTMDHPHFLEAVANLLASAVQRFGAEHAMHSANEELRRLDALNQQLTSLGQRMAAELDVDAITQMATDQATELAGAEFGAFFFNVVKDDGDEYMLYTLSGVPKERFASFPMPRKTAVFAPTFAGQGTVRSDDITQDERYGKNAPHKGIPRGHLPVRSYLAVPVKSKQGDVIGGLFLGHSQPARFGPAHERAVEALAGMAAVALQNARLYQESRRSAQAAREASERAQEADRRKDEFLAMLGHELRNPLAPIKISLDLLARRGGPPLREHEMIGRQVKHLIQLVDDLMDVSRITRGLVKLKREPVTLAAVVDRAMEMAQPLIEQRQHAVDLEIDDVHIDADFERMAQVVANLVTNAAKYTEPGGRICIGVREEDGQAVLSVTDNGVGIPADLLPHVFESFRQGAQGSDRNRGGLGLGLAIVHNLTQLHGGTVEAQSDGPGHGSTFTVRLPTAAPPVRLADAPPMTELPPAHGRVLVVDDNPDVAESLRQVVEALGCDVRVAMDGPTALQIAAEFHPEMVLLDIGLPVMDGYELAAALRRLRGDTVRLVAISGYGGRKDRDRSRAAGINEHLVKPVSIDEIREALQAIRPRVVRP